MTLRIALLTLVALVAAAGLAGCSGGSSTPPTTVTVTAPPSLDGTSSDTAAAAPPTQVTIPSVVGQNGAIALDTLKDAGLTKVDTATKDASSRVVLNPANWTVTRVEPKAGTKIMSNRTVVVTMTKE